VATAQERDQQQKGEKNGNGSFHRFTSPPH
jgi:hypothetical protein